MTACSPLQFWPESTSGTVTLEVYDAQQQRLASRISTGDGQRIDLPATAGQTFFVGLRGAHVPTTVQLTNLVCRQGNRLELRGTDGNDSLQLIVGQRLEVTVNGVSYALDGPLPGQVLIQAGGGYDTLRLSTGAGNDTATLRVGGLKVDGPGYVLEGYDLEQQYVDGGAGWNTAYLTDSPGRDVFRGWPTSSVFQGAGFRHHVQGFADVRAFARQGGADHAQLVGSVASDTFQGRPRVSRLSGADFRLFVYGFRSVRGQIPGSGTKTTYVVDARQDPHHAARRQPVVQIQTRRDPHDGKLRVPRRGNGRSTEPCGPSRAVHRCSVSMTWQRPTMVCSNGCVRTPSILPPPTSCSASTADSVAPARSRAACARLPRCVGQQDVVGDPALVRLVPLLSRGCALLPHGKIVGTPVQAPLIFRFGRGPFLVLPESLTELCVQSIIPRVKAHGLTCRVHRLRELPEIRVDPLHGIPGPRCLHAALRRRLLLELYDVMSSHFARGAS